ncbi:D-alanine--D-alanine ligase family protein [Pseudoglutamicibacter cumminsii]|uniref:D-alanine--D-alanine ligase family protein n=1 Tax=Pseudoglutamicibacter cumminsii TaxID=156979 RepID=UPI002552867E|nr:D-alanine--D-alanine ligase family protein [Pseudoglutamicibacter cumminsii]MDK7082542.1 D-alanine--D-alanine ligase family protein [Pseudoglutamicibacter cumminsii]
MTTSQKRVLLLFGGQSSEHSVSCVTAAGVLRAIDTDRFTVIPVSVTQDGRWTVVPPQQVLTYSFDGGVEPVVELQGQPVRLMRSEDSDAAARLVTDAQPGEMVKLLAGIDVVFPLLHGPYGEDGTVQGFLELLGVPYVGSGVAASAVGMDKHLMKMAFSAAGLRVGPYQVVTDREWDADPQGCLDRCEGLELPLFVKPARAGSSQGVVRVDDREDLSLAIEEARMHDPKVLVEQGISGREIECAALEGRRGKPTRASVGGEVVVDAAAADLYDYESKYLADDNARTEAPARLTDEQADSLSEQAVVAYDALGCEGPARVDFFLDEAGEWIINEINTMPGFTPISMYPQLWAASGLPYEDLITELITLALERRAGLLR